MHLRYREFHRDAGKALPVRRAAGAVDQIGVGAAVEVEPDARGKIGRGVIDGDEGHDRDAVCNPRTAGALRAGIAVVEGPVNGRACG